MCVCVFLCGLNKLLKKSSKFLLCLIPFYSIQKCFCITKNGEVYWGGHFDILLSQFGISLPLHVQIKLLLLDLHTDFSGGREDGLVFPSL